jgi:hypothetical protein
MRENNLFGVFVISEEVVYFPGSNLIGKGNVTPPT